MVIKSEVCEYQSQRNVQQKNSDTFLPFIISKSRKTYQVSEFDIKCFSGFYTIPALPLRNGLALPSLKVVADFRQKCARRSTMHVFIKKFSKT
jgi:hypothetical protein